jgi:hypothetical protein
MLSGFLQYLAYAIVSALLGLLSITDMLGVDAASAASSQFKQLLNAEPELTAGLAMAAR